MATLLVPITVAILAILVLLADLVPAEGGSRGIGVLSAAGLAGVFILAGLSPFGSSFAGTWSNDAQNWK